MWTDECSFIHKSQYAIIARVVNKYFLMLLSNRHTIPQILILQHRALRLLVNVVLVLVLITSAYSFLVNSFFTKRYDQQYFELAKQMLAGKLYFSSDPSYSYPYADCTLYEGEYYWPLGVFPALLFIPFVNLFEAGYAQGIASGVLTVVNFYLLFVLGTRFTGSRSKAFYLSIAYIFGSAYFFVAYLSVSWYFAHIVVTTSLLLALTFTFVKARPVVAGLFFTLSFLSRISTFFVVGFFIFNYLGNGTKQSVRNLCKFFIPVFIGITLFFSYNYIRFDNPFDTGYGQQSLFNELEANRKNGLWSLKHFPANIYFFLLKGPEANFFEGTKVVKDIYPNNWGMSIVFTTPILIYLVFLNTRSRVVKASLIGVTPAVLFLLGSFGIGAYQYGYRFALDFQPFLFVILFAVFEKRGFGVMPKIVLIISILFNTYMCFNFDLYDPSREKCTSCTGGIHSFYVPTEGQIMPVVAESFNEEIQV